jgi:hypothetical protein
MNKDVIESLSQTLIFTLTCYQHSLANRREREREKSIECIYTSQRKSEFKKGKNVFGKSYTT